MWRVLAGWSRLLVLEGLGTVILGLGELPWSPHLSVQLNFALDCNAYLWCLLKLMKTRAGKGFHNCPFSPKEGAPVWRSVLFDSLRPYGPCQAPLSMGFPRQEYWSWVAISCPRGSSQPRDRTCVSRIAGSLLHPKWLLYQPPGKPWTCIYSQHFSPSTNPNHGSKGTLDCIVHIGYWVHI